MRLPPSYLLLLACFASFSLANHNGVAHLVFDDSFNNLRDQINNRFASIPFPPRNIRYEMLRLNFLLQPRPIDPLAVQYVAGQILSMIASSGQSSPEYNSFRQSVSQLVTEAGNQAQNNPGMGAGISNPGNTGSSGSGPVEINPNGNASPTPTQSNGGSSSTALTPQSSTSSPTSSTSVISSSSTASSPTSISSTSSITQASPSPTSSSLTSTASATDSSSMTATSSTVPTPSISPSATGPNGFVNVTGNPTSPDSPYNPKNLFKPPFQPTQSSTSQRTISVIRIFSSLSLLVVSMLIL